MTTWIFCAGMKRAASTLQYQVASHLIEDARRGSRMPWSPVGEFPELRRRHSGSDAWRVFKSHECSPEIADELRGGGARGFTTVRDLRDVIASQMVMMRTGFDRLWSTGFLQECVDQHTDWAALPAMAVTSYEAIVADPAGHVQQIAAHLEIPLTGAEAAEIAAEYSPERQRARIAAADAAEWRTVPALDGELVFDPHTLLHRNHLQSGRPGAWREILTKDESDRVKDVFGDWLAANGYEV